MYHLDNTYIEDYNGKIKKTQILVFEERWTENMLEFSRFYYVFGNIANMKKYE